MYFVNLNLMLIIKEFKVQVWNRSDKEPPIEFFFTSQIAQNFEKKSALAGFELTTSHLPAGRLDHSATRSSAEAMSMLEM